ncbi:bifunctional diguanylate cyclase/phosphodiesterase [Colwellia sp. E2M01]|uniref:GGDEF domain-containing protein n=1 Tax=Colwellia sp. E2M01 TaxID=2841561 RepID=UPI001C09D126|nr:bifunctional diguanylate cyclase/phosphodiesterase [Colwellia sp. E2M01]MBU2871847.1 EAL and GGDEF domain-containing protein [Colwellia sp. E2M01]
MNNITLLAAELNNILEKETLTTYFQPIFDISNQKIWGYEALTRVEKDSLFSSPLELFKTAFALGRLSELESLCRKIAFKNFTKQQLDGLLFLNISPLVLGDKNHQSGETIGLIKQYGLSAERVVIEVTEMFDSKDTEYLKESLTYYRKMGFKIAIDDLGTGHSGLMQWAELRPDIVKIDKYFIQDSHKNIVKRELLRTIFELGKATGVKIIAEGIETHEEFLLLEKLGMQFAQGFLLARPAAQPLRTVPNIVTFRKAASNQNSSEVNTEIIDLTSVTPALTMDERCSAVYKRFDLDNRLFSLAVVDCDNVPVGIIHKDKLTELFSSQYGYALYNNKPIATVMSQLPFIVDIQASLVEVSDLITSDQSLTMRQEFIVTDQGKYLGLANIHILLKRITEQKIQFAQHANPLSMLPGNIVIEQKITQHITKNIPFTLAYLDLNFFKPFNDLYGYAAGDAVIKLVADVVSVCCDSDEDFIGHVGGDDFVIIFKTQHWLKKCEEILQIFSQRVQDYFKPEHIQANGYESNNRNDENQFFPLLNLSCGVIQPDIRFCLSHLDVASLATEAKKKSKLMINNQVYVHNKRQPDNLIDYDELIAIHTDIDKIMSS